MSRVGLRPIPLPPGVKVITQGNEVTVEGSKGKLCRSFHPDISVTLIDENLIVSRPSDSRIHRSLHGLTRSLVANMVEGVTKGFEKTLELSGVGYRAQKADNKLSLQIGYSHPVDFSPPSGVDIVVEGTNRVRVIGIDKEVVGETAARIRAIRPADAYKGKGIRYAGERLRRKAGKAGKAALRG
ncbi:MAG: 50S ribosomal protein L6 [Dehalococcoidia bacterium]|nr:50S ribosomal protein L6 [Dehalococcoidia bacterium]